VVSSQVIIKRDIIQKDVSKQLVKTEFLVDKITSVMDLKSGVISATRLIYGKTLERPLE
jgi:hypothetical protein